MSFITLPRLFLLLLCAWPLAAAAQEREDWQIAREGSLSVLYPAGLFADDAGPTEQGTGQKLRWRDGDVLFAFYRLENPERHSPRSYLANKLVVDQSNILYRRVTDRFFAISSIRNGRIFYSRCNFRGSLHCIYLDYPQSRKRALDRIVTRISHSLR
jgi:hypothetical protein